MPWDYSIWQPFSTSHPLHTVPNNGAHVFYSSRSTQTIAPNSVYYVKLYFNSHDTQRCYHQHGHCYVGSTAIGMPRRQHNRRAKLKQLAKNTPISAELSLRYWHATNHHPVLHHPHCYIPGL